MSPFVFSNITKIRRELFVSLSIQLLHQSNKNIKRQRVYHIVRINQRQKKKNIIHIYTNRHIDIYEPLIISCSRIGIIFPISMFCLRINYPITFERKVFQVVVVIVWVPCDLVYMSTRLTYTQRKNCTTYIKSVFASFPHTRFVQYSDHFYQKPAPHLHFIMKFLVRQIYYSSIYVA